MRILAGGCFNKIHLGHIHFLQKSRLIMGKKSELFVVLTNDKNNRKKRAIKVGIRKKNLEALGIAVQVVIGAAVDYKKTMVKIKPDVIILGYDQKLPRQLKEYVKDQKILVKRAPELKDYRKRDNDVIGRVFSGKGTGQKFMKLAGYEQAFQAKTGEEFFPGTLNVQVAFADVRQFFQPKKIIKIPGFKEKGEKFGAVTLYPARLKIYKFEGSSLKLPFKRYLKQEKIWVVRPQKTGYNSRVIEILHQENLRQKFSLKDDSLLEIIF